MNWKFWRKKNVIINVNKTDAALIMEDTGKLVMIMPRELPNDPSNVYYMSMFANLLSSDKEKDKDLEAIWGVLHGWFKNKENL